MDGTDELFGELDGFFFSEEFFFKQKGEEFLLQVFHEEECIFIGFVGLVDLDDVIMVERGKNFKFFNAWWVGWVSVVEDFDCNIFASLSVDTFEYLAGSPFTKKNLGVDLVTSVVFSLGDVVFKWVDVSFENFFDFILVLDWLDLSAGLLFVWLGIKVVVGVGCLFEHFVLVVVGC